MDIHYSQDYFWVDSTGKRIQYNELDYVDLSSAIDAFEEKKMKFGKLNPVVSIYRDIDTISTDFLVKNVEDAFLVWKRGPSAGISFENFCNDILPYRVSTEPIQNWRNVYRGKYTWLSDSLKNDITPERMLGLVAADFKSWFTNTWDIEKRTDPLPRLGPLQLLTRKRGNCDDIGDLQVYVLRSQGIPARLEYIPFWATSTGRHFFNSTYTRYTKNIPFDVSTAAVKIDNFSREPSKVLRVTYAKQLNCLANQVPIDEIPEGFMRSYNYLDVTSEYWQTGTVSMKLFQTKTPQKVAYISVLNGLKWQPTWWGKVSGEAVSFNNMCKGAVFLPSYYIKGRLLPAGFPLAYGYNNTLLLKPDMTKKRRIEIKEQDKYLIFQAGKMYKLYYWNLGWKLIAQQTADEIKKQMVFNNVPSNSLLLLIPEYSIGKERPFVITDKNERIWF